MKSDTLLLGTNKKKRSFTLVTVKTNVCSSKVRTLQIRDGDNIFLFLKESNGDPFVITDVNIKLDVIPFFVTLPLNEMHRLT